MFNKLQSFIAILFAFLFLFIGLMPCVAYAADDPPLVSGINNTEIIISSEYRNVNTALAVFEYYNIMYNYNMSNGQKLIAVAFNSSGKMHLIFNNINGNAVFAARLYQNNARYINLYSGPSVFASGGWCPGSLYNFGNVKYDTGSWGSCTGYAVELPNGTNKVVFVGELGYEHIGFSDSETSTDISIAPVAPSISAMRMALIDYINTIAGSVSSGDPVVLDFGSIISAIMTAPMIMFGGLTGSPGNLENSLVLFGIDIRLTLISLLVIAIVVFIIKFLRGG